MLGQLIINGKDAYSNWGVTLDDTSLSSLMTPPASKEFTENKSRSIDGKIVSVKNPRVEERDFMLQINLTAPNRSLFVQRYNSFCQELATGRLNIATIFLPGVTFKTIYKSCRQFTQFNGQIGKFILSLNEPDPTDRI